MNKKHAREALDIYKRFLIRMDRVGEFLKTAEKFGIDKQDIPDLARVRIKSGFLNLSYRIIISPRYLCLPKAPSSLLEALESHLANLEGRKPGSTTSPAAGAQGNRYVPDYLFGVPMRTNCCHLSGYPTLLFLKYFDLVLSCNFFSLNKLYFISLYLILEFYVSS